MKKSERISLVIIMMIVVALSFAIIYMYYNCCSVKSRLFEAEKKIEELERQIYRLDLLIEE